MNELELRLEKEIALAAEIEARHQVRGHTVFIDASDSLAFVDVCAARRMRIWGVEGFRLGPDYTAPDMGLILDLSDGGTPQQSTDAARTFVARFSQPDLWFVFTLDWGGTAEVARI